MEELLGVQLEVCQQPLLAVLVDLEVLFGEVCQFNPNRKPPLQFGHQLTRLGPVKRSRRDE